MTALLARLDMDMDEFQEEIEAQEDEGDNADESMEACADERFEWQAGFGALLKILSGDVAAITDASEDGWRSALTAWCLLVRPGLKRDDLPYAYRADLQGRELMLLAQLDNTDNHIKPATRSNALQRIDIHSSDQRGRCKSPPPGLGNRHLALRSSLRPILQARLTRRSNK